MEKQNTDNLSTAIVDEDTLNLLTTAFELYNIAKLDYNVYRKDSDLSIPKSLIVQYYKRIKPNYNNMIYGFRRKYVSNELLVEKNDTPEERQGLNMIYDFIQNFDIDNDYFNIFVTAMQIHSILYKPLDKKNNKDIESARRKVSELLEEAKKERNLAKYREAQDLKKSISEQHNFGGQLRDTSVVMQGFRVSIPDAKEVLKRFNEYLSPEKIQEYNEALNNPDIFAYIDYAVNTTADLIGMQPFGDGNKRTFRSLLNLMFKKKNLPPVYITRKERKAYHDALEKAICEHDYSLLDAFYYYKICDSIYELDFEKYINAAGTCDAKVNVKK